MIYIEYVRIKYFRSIYSLELNGLKDVSVLSGTNDIGKSNILKALNLFFNNQSDWQTPFDFKKDYCKKRLDENRATVKSKQYIQITIGFVRGEGSTITLPEKFEVTRTWSRNSISPTETTSLEKHFKSGKVKTKNLDRAQASLQRFLGSFRYEYVPAIKDAELFRYTMGRLQDTILGKKTSGSEIISEAVKDLNSSVETESIRLNEEFKRVAGVEAHIRLPDQLSVLFRAFSVATKIDKSDIPMEMRGDGIKCRFIPSLLHYITENSNLSYIWGFEEPENSLEHGLATKLASDMVGNYSKSCQILTTSHSPAFVTLNDEKVLVSRVVRDENGTIIKDNPTEELYSQLEQDLGLLELQKSYQNEFKKKVDDLNNRRNEVASLHERLKLENSPVLVTEGKWDVAILKTAWAKLYGSSSLSFRIESCNSMPEDSNLSAAGVTVLKSFIETVRPTESIAIGLFDHDTEGLNKGFNNLNANFYKKSVIGIDCKLQKHGTSGAVLVPVVDGRENYAANANLPLEFLFTDEVISKQVKGEGLELVPGEIQQVVSGTGHRLPTVVSADPALRRIKDESKKKFVEKVLPTLNKDDFNNFIPLFDHIQAVISELTVLRST